MDDVLDYICTLHNSRDFHRSLSLLVSIQARWGVCNEMGRKTEMFLREHSSRERIARLCKELMSGAQGVLLGEPTLPLSVLPDLGVGEY